MEGESGEQVGGELESVTSSAGCFMQGWRNETGKYNGSEKLTTDNTSSETTNVPRTWLVITINWRL